MNLFDFEIYGGNRILFEILIKLRAGGIDSSCDYP